MSAMIVLIMSFLMGRPLLVAVSAQQAMYSSRRPAFACLPQAATRAAASCDPDCAAEDSPHKLMAVAKTMDAMIFMSASISRTDEGSVSREVVPRKQACHRGRRHVP